MNIMRIVYQFNRRQAFSIRIACFSQQFFCGFDVGIFEIVAADGAEVTAWCSISQTGRHPGQGDPLLSLHHVGDDGLTIDGQTECLTDLRIVQRRFFHIESEEIGAKIG